MKKIVIIGQGNVATHMQRAFDGNAEIIAVNSRTPEEIPKKADLYLICVKDDAIKEVAKKIGKVDGIVAHTSGSTSMAVLEEHSRHGVFYPLQTFSKSRELEYSAIPIFIEANESTTLKEMESIAGIISQNVKIADSEQRKKLHIAAVFACNFTIKLCDIADKILHQIGSGVSDLQPLLEETIAKLREISPSEAQTGPAKRKDTSIIESHIQFLKSEGMIEESELYKILSETIMNN